MYTDLTLIIMRGKIASHKVFHSHIQHIVLSLGTLPLAQGYMAKSEDPYCAGGV